MTPSMSSTLSSVQYKTILVTKNIFAHRLILYPLKSSFHRHQFKGETVNSLLFLLKEQQSFQHSSSKVKETNKQKKNHETKKLTNQYSTNFERRVSTHLPLFQRTKGNDTRHVKYAVTGLVKDYPCHKKHFRTPLNSLPT